MIRFDAPTGNACIASNGDIFFYASIATGDPNPSAAWRETYFVFTAAVAGIPASIQEAKVPWNFGLVALGSFNAAHNLLNSADNTLLLPVEMMVDGNRDGEIKIGSGSDQTTQDKPYKFWINNNHDGYCTVTGETDVQDDLPVTSNTIDSSNENIQCTRDLEDYARLWIDIKQLAPMVKANNGISIGLKFNPPPNGNDPTPEIKIFKAVEADGGTEYLTDPDTANNQIGGEYDVPVEDTSGHTKVGSSAFILPQDFWDDVDENTPKHLIFEGVTVGKGQLEIVIYKDGQQIGEGGALYMDLRDIKQFYERWTVGDGPGTLFGLVTGSGGDPGSLHISTDRLPVGVTGLQYSSSDSGLSISSDPNTNKYVLFVHGWNLAPWEKDAFAECALKRLFWQGYKGKFGTFQWPTTYVNAGNDYFHFDTLHQITAYDWGEYSAWKSSPLLAALLGQLHAKYNGAYLLAHSMGNVVAGEALRIAGQSGAGQLVNSYAGSQAAVPAQCYDASQEGSNPLFTRLPFIGYVDIRGPQTPNIYDNWMMPPHLAVNSKASFYNVNDYALGYWQLDQKMKPDGLAGPHPSYGYDGDPNAAPVENGFYNSVPDPANQAQPTAFGNAGSSKRSLRNHGFRLRTA